MGMNGVASSNRLVLLDIEYRLHILQQLGINQCRLRSVVLQVGFGLLQRRP